MCTYIWCATSGMEPEQCGQSSYQLVWLVLGWLALLMHKLLFSLFSYSFSIVSWMVRHFFNLVLFLVLLFCQCAARWVWWMSWGIFASLCAFIHVTRVAFECVWLSVRNTQWWLYLAAFLSFCRSAFQYIVQRFYLFIYFLLESVQESC